MGRMDEFVDGFWVPGAMPPIDARRPPKERVIGVPSSELDSGIGFPFDALTDLAGAFQAIEFTY